MKPIRSLLITLLLPLMMAAAHVNAQPQPVAAGTDNPAQLAGEVDPGQLQSLIDTLEDPERRAQFIDRLTTLRAIQQQDAASATATEDTRSGLADALMNLAGGAVDSLSSRVESAAGYLEAAPGALRDAGTALMDPSQRVTVIEIVSKVLGTLAVALLVAWLTGRLLGRPGQHLEERSTQNPLTRLLVMLIALVVRLVPLAVFMGVAYLALPVIEPRPLTRTVLLSLVYAHVIAQAIMTLTRVALSVDAPAQRPWHLADETAAYIYIWIRRVTIIAVYGYFINQALLLLGLDQGSHGLLVDLTGLVVALLFVALVLQNRHAVADAIRGGENVSGLAAQLRGTLALFWHLLALLYIAGVYMVWATEVEGGFTFLVWRTVITLAVLLGARIALSLSERGMERLFHLPGRLRQQYPGLEQRADRYRPAVTRILKGFLLLIAVLAVGQAWGLGAASLFTTDAGQALLARFLRILLIITVGLLIWEVAAALIERKLHAADGNTRRMATVLPLLKNIVRLTIGAVAIMIVLSELGMNIGPLIASAGVIGLAVGFGAQTLVRDLISGMFVIFEDIIAVGDWVEIGAHTGIVESMHIRTMELRDLSGNIRVIPFGDVTSVHKVANDYSYAMIIIGVAYREDVDEVIGLLQRIDEEMCQDDKWKNIILEPMTVDGVNDMAASSIDIRLRIKCRPLEQWALRREFLGRTKKLFDAEGIEIPFPHQTIYFGEDKDGGAPAAHIRLHGLQEEMRQEAARKEEPAGDDPADPDQKDENTSVRRKD